MKPVSRNFQVAAQHAVARAKLGKGACYFDLKKDDNGRHFLEALPPSRMGATRSSPICTLKACWQSGKKLVDKEMLDDAAAVFRTGLDRFASNADGALHDTVSLIFFNLGSALTEQKRDQDALANYERLLIHLQTSTGPSSADEVSDALWRKGHSLQRLGRKDEALQAWASAIDRCGDDNSCAEAPAFATADPPGHTAERTAVAPAARSALGLPLHQPARGKAGHLSRVHRSGRQHQRTARGVGDAYLCYTMF